MNSELLEDRVLLAVGPQLVAISPNDGSQLSLDSVSKLDVAPRDLTFRFNDGQELNPVSVAGGVRIVRSGLDGEFDNTSIDVVPGFIGVGEFPNEVIIRFAEALPDDLYRITIDGTGDDALENELEEPFNDGVDQIVDFELNLGVQVVAVVPQPITRNPDTGELTQAEDQIVVYFNEDDLHESVVTTGDLPTDPTVVDPSFYQLIATQVEPGSDSVSNLDDVVVHPTSIVYDPATDTAVLTFADSLDALPSGPGTYRLRLGTDEALPSPPQIVVVDADEDTGDESSGTVIDNDLLPGVPGQFSFSVADGGASGVFAPGGGVTIEGRENSYLDEDFIFEFLNFIQIDTGNPAMDGIVELGGFGSVVTDPAASNGEDSVASSGFFLGPNGIVFWTVESKIADGDNRLVNTITLEADTSVDPAATLGDLRFINYIDQDIDITIADDFLLQIGTPGDADFRVSSRDGTDGVGLDQGGFYQAGPELVNATYEGWAADQVFDLQDDIFSLDAEFSIDGEIDTVALPPTTDSEFGPIHGYADVSTAFAWLIEPGEQVATITTFLELDAETGAPADPDPIAPGSSFETSLPVGLDQTGILVKGDGTAFVDGQTISIADENGTLVVFEMNDPSVDPVVTLGRTEIPFDSADSLEEIVESIQTAIENSSLDVDARIFGSEITVTRADTIVLDPTMSGASVERLNSVILSSSIDPEFFPLDFPGFEDEPGHRETSVQSHTSGVDEFVGIRTIPYNFQDEYGFDPNGNVLHNVITDNQIQRTREIFELYSYYLGVQFVETEDQGFTIVTGDLRATSPEVPTGPGGVAGIASSANSTAIMDAAEDWDDSFRGSWFDTAMHEIGHLLGLGHTDELPPGTVMNDDVALAFDSIPEAIFPGDADIVHGQLLHRPESNDIDLYRFELESAGRFTAETIAERNPEGSSTLDTVLRLYREDENGVRTLVSQNDDYFSEDSLIEMSLTPGTYFIGVSASGNSSYDPVIEGTGFGGRSQGDYDLRMNFRPDVDSSGIIRDIDITDGDIAGTAFDGDHDGTPGGVYNFWFQVQGASKTLIVDKSFQGVSDGSLSSPYKNLDDAMLVATPGDIVRVVGNGGADGELDTLTDNLAYEIGQPPVVGTLADGARLNVPKGVTLMIDAGAVFKMWNSTISVGSTTVLVDRSESALQVLGTPDQSVIFTSYNDQSIGFDTNPLNTTPSPGDWGGLVLNNELDRAESRFDYEAQGVFLNSINNADIRYGGGAVSVASVLQVIDPIHLVDSRPTISYNSITFSADAAISANPDSFEESNFQGPDSIRSDYQASGAFTSGYKRVGPDIHGNTVTDNTINGLFVRIDTPAGNQLETLTVTGRFDDTDITHVVSENLVIAGTPGGPMLDSVTGQFLARTDAQLTVDPGVVVKLDGARIEIDLGAQLIAEGREGRDVVFTSLLDSRFGAGGTFDTSSDGGATDAAPGDWSGLYAGSASTLSLNHATVAYGGGLSRVEGSFAGFNAIEIHQATARIANSLLEFNDSGVGGQAEPDRVGRGINEQAAIFVRGAQPIIVDNIIRDTSGAVSGAININVNSLNYFEIADYGLSRGEIDRVTSYQDNSGPLVRDNRIENNGINGMIVRGGTLTTEGVWDDTDIVHVLFDEVVVPDLHTFGGLRLASTITESLVIKLFGEDAGFTSSGRPLEIVDRVGGMLHILGQPGHPVVLTSLADDTVGAGFDTLGQPQLDTDNGVLDASQPGDWRGIHIEQYSHDRNFVPLVETEVSSASTQGVNEDPDTAQFLGELAPSEKSSDDNLRLGFDVQGFLSNPSDVDVYVFEAVAGTEVWLDIDATSSDLDVVVELILSDGTVLARSTNSLDEGVEGDGLFTAPGIAATGLQKSLFHAKDHWSVNPNDAGMRLLLPGTAGSQLSYHVRVRSNTPDGEIDDVSAGLTSGAYDLQVRIQEADEFAGTTVMYSDIRYATNGVVVRGAPYHSPLLGESGEDASENDRESRPTVRDWEDYNNGSYRGLLRSPPQPPGPFDAVPYELDFQEPQNLGNILASDLGAIGVSGAIDTPGDVDLYMFEVAYGSVQDIEDFSADRFVELAFDLDYADGLSRADTNMWIYEADIRPSGEVWRGKIVYASQASGDPDDLPRPGEGGDLENLSGGSTGTLDPYVGSTSLPEGSYIIAISGSQTVGDDTFELIPADLNQFDTRIPLNPFIRLGPVDSTLLLADDRIDEPSLAPVLFNEESVTPYFLNDIDLFVSSTDGTNTSVSLVDPFLGILEVGLTANGVVLGDLELRDDDNDFIFGYGQGTNDENSGGLIAIDAKNQAILPVGDDGIETYVMGAMDPERAEDPTGPADNMDGVGIQFEAITFLGTDTGFAVGNRTDAATGVAVMPPENAIFQFNPNTGAAINRTDNDTRADAAVLDGIGTQIVEIGIVDTTVGGGPGGLVTGIAFLGDRLFAVSDLGGLYEITDYNLDTPAQTTFISEIVKRDKVGDPILDGMNMPIPIEFAGLTLGPGVVEEGAYAEMLFAIDASGDLYAMNDLGELQGIFVDAERSISTGITDATGLTFSTHQENLWHITEQRGAESDVGHRYNEDLAEFDPSYVNKSFYFGLDGDSNYDVIGGSRGSVISDSLSLDGYSASDQPVLYFDYFLVTEDATDDPERDPDTMTDSFRVYASDDTGQWHLLATNNDRELGDDDDDFNVDASPFDNIDIDVQQLFDNSYEDIPDPLLAPQITGALPRYPDRGVPPVGGAPNATAPSLTPDETEGVWRQARIDLSDFAGMEDVRLRFEFSTAGSIDFGDVVRDPMGNFVRFGQGAELQAVPGADLRDGDILTLLTPGTPPVFSEFEVEMGLTLVTPTGSRIVPGETFSVSNGVDTVVFELTDDAASVVGNIPIEINSQMTAFEVATEVDLAIFNNAPAGVIPLAVGNRIQLVNAADVVLDADPAMSVEGDVGTTGIPIDVDSIMTSEEVAGVMSFAFANEFANGNLQVIKAHHDVIEVIGHQVIDQGPFGYADSLPGDEVGDLFSPARMLNNSGQPIPNDASDLDTIEGAYFDNIVIGFASRGEQIRDEQERIGPGRVQGAPAVVSREYYLSEPMTFTARETDSEPIEVGEYQLEIRTVGTFTDGQGVSVVSLDPRIRVSQSATLFAPSGIDIADSQTFTIATGTTSVTFEYEDLELGNDVTPGNIPVGFFVSDSDAVVAERIRAAINSSALDVIAASPEGIELGPAESNFIDLFGDVFIQEEEAPNGIPFLVNDILTGGQNRHRAQGQMLITSNTISHSAEFGIVVDDGIRDLPTYQSDETPWAEPKQDHAQYTTGDYIPHPGPARNLVELNDQSLAPGVTIENNVIHDGGTGGINFKGDPNGYVMVAPFGVVGIGDEIYDVGSLIFTFSITDHNGLTEVFEFEQDPGGGGVVAGNVPINFPINMSCACTPRADMAPAIREAIESTALDVTVYLGKIDELFIEGAAEVVGILSGGVNSPGWLEPWIHRVTPGAVPFGRIINNTIVGVGGSLTPDVAGDVGILIEDNSSPTLLNNIVANFVVGIAADNSIQGAVHGSSLFQGNLNDIFNFTPGDFGISLLDSEPLFVSIRNDNFYLQAESLAIDSAIDSLEDRPSLVTVRDPLGIAVSPILAPQFDVLGQQRVDDPSVEPPEGVGNNVFKDRGAIDRVDFIGPMAQLVKPLDNDGEGVDLNPAETVVRWSGGPLNNFSIQLFDGSSQNNLMDGTGVSPFTVISDAITILADDVALEEHIDYLFTYDTTNSVIILTPEVGVWDVEKNYRILLDNSIITDLASNPLSPNQPSGQTSFLIELGDGLGIDYGDAPDPTYATLLASEGARHTLDGALFLGNSVDSESDGQPSLDATGDGADEDGLLSSTDLDVGTMEFFRIRSSGPGFLDAWIDFNSDGDWNDPGEKIFDSVAVIAGDNDLTASIPVTATRTDTFARFRLSSQGGLAPVGLADDGEVEDYMVSISGNPWQNSANPFDVNGDEQLTPLDALLVINELGASIFSHPVTGELPTIPVAPHVPPSTDPLNPAFFVDVNGSPTDGGQFFLTPLDALLVINELDAQSPGSSSAGSGASAGASAALFAEPVGKSSGSSRASASAISHNGSSQAGSQEFVVSFVAHGLPNADRFSGQGESLFVDTWAAIESDRPESGYVDQAISEFDAESSFDHAGWAPQSDDGLRQFARLDRDRRLSARDLDSQGSSWSEEWELPEEMDLDALDEMYGAYDMG